MIRSVSESTRRERYSRSSHSSRASSAVGPVWVTQVATEGLAPGTQIQSSRGGLRRVEEVHAPVDAAHHADALGDEVLASLDEAAATPTTRDRGRRLEGRARAARRGRPPGRRWDRTCRRCAPRTAIWPSGAGGTGRPATYRPPAGRVPADWSSTGCPRSPTPPARRSWPGPIGWRRRGRRWCWERSSPRACVRRRRRQRGCGCACGR